MSEISDLHDHPSNVEELIANDAEANVSIIFICMNNE